MPSSEPPPGHRTVSLIGCGRAGGAVALALHRAGWPLLGVWSRTSASARRLSRLTGAPGPRGPGGIVLVAVPDDAISSVAESLEGLDNTLVVHLSGSTSVDALRPLPRRASLHPLQTLPDAVRGADALPGAAVAVTARTDADRRILRALARAWGGRPFDLPDADKPRYHAAAVFASNYLVASLYAAERLLDGVALPKGALLPLAQASVANASSRGARSAITGPAARGDVRTMRRHLRAIQDPALRSAYRA